MDPCGAETLPTPRKRLEPVRGKDAGDSARSGCWGLCNPMPLLSISVHWHGKPRGRLSQDAANSGQVGAGTGDSSEQDSRAQLERQPKRQRQRARVELGEGGNIETWGPFQGLTTKAPRGEACGFWPPSANVHPLRYKGRQTPLLGRATDGRGHAGGPQGLGTAT